MVWFWGHIASLPLEKSGERLHTNKSHPFSRRIRLRFASSQPLQTRMTKRFFGPLIALAVVTVFLISLCNGLPQQASFDPRISQNRNVSRLWRPEYPPCVRHGVGRFDLSFISCLLVHNKYLWGNNPEGKFWKVLIHMQGVVVGSTLDHRLMLACAPFLEVEKETYSWQRPAAKHRDFASFWGQTGRPVPTT